LPRNRFVSSAGVVFSGRVVLESPGLSAWAQIPAGRAQFSRALGDSKPGLDSNCFPLPDGSSWVGNVLLIVMPRARLDPSHCPGLGLAWADSGLRLFRPSPRPRRGLGPVWIGLESWLRATAENWRYDLTLGHNICFMPVKYSFLLKA
jgi:hypothetical protein